MIPKYELIRIKLRIMINMIREDFLKENRQVNPNLVITWLESILKILNKK